MNIHAQLSTRMREVGHFLTYNFFEVCTIGDTENWADVSFSCQNF
jgi:hypothetical protein